jgi:hypothetical protein
MLAGAGFARVEVNQLPHDLRELLIRRTRPPKRGPTERITEQQQRAGPGATTL